MGQKGVGMLLALTVLVVPTLAAEKEAMSDKVIGTRFTDVDTQSNAPHILAVKTLIVPFNGSNPLTLLTLIDCLNQTHAYYHVNEKKIVVKPFRLYKGMIKHSGPSREVKLCNQYYWDREP